MTVRTAEVVKVGKDQQDELDVSTAHEGISDIKGASGDLVGQSDYVEVLARSHNQIADSLKPLIEALLIAQQNYMESAEQLKKIAPQAADQAANLYLYGELAEALKAELDELLEQEAGLSRLVAAQQETVDSCRGVLEAAKTRLISGNLYSDEQPAEAIDAAALQLASNDSSDLLTQSAALSYDTTINLLAISTSKLNELRGRIAKKQAELNGVIEFSAKYADDSLGDNGSKIADARSIGHFGLTVLGQALEEGKVSTVLSAALHSTPQNNIDNMTNLVDSMLAIEG